MVHDGSSPTLLLLPLKDIVPDLPVQLDQLPVCTRSRALPGALNTLLQIGQPAAIVFATGKIGEVICHALRALCTGWRTFKDQLSSWRHLLGKAGGQQVKPDHTIAPHHNVPAKFKCRTSC
ncbi:hypothetical protein [Paraburkholderia tropica]|uniref:hypothetical protein n=1 Tax=Paraburkholderia tropica TaxID=92647 RepID=UPI001F2A30CC|nr:hypothetical protein [Paraburkholderia tropica]